MMPDQPCIELPDKHPLRIRAEAAEAALAAAQAEQDAALQRAEAMRQERDAALDALVDRGRIIGQFQQQVATLKAINHAAALRWPHDWPASLVEANAELIAEVERLTAKADEELDVKARLAEVNEQLRHEARWNPLEDYHKRHVPSCRKHMYDQKASPCSCVVEYDREFIRANANERILGEVIKQRDAALAERDDERLRYDGMRADRDDWRKRCEAAQSALDALRGELVIAGVNHIDAMQAHELEKTCRDRNWNDLKYVRAALDNECRYSEQLTAALTEARLVLREVEWRGHTEMARLPLPPLPHGYRCPSCGMPKNYGGHLTDCALSAVLAQED